MAFVMVVVMVYDFRTADVAPETRRSRVLYNYGTQCMRPDGTNMWGYRGLGPTAFHAFFDDLPGVDELTFHGGLRKAVCALPASSDRHSVLIRPVAANWFEFFRYDFLAGRPFTQAEYDAGRAALEKADDEWRSVRNRDDGVVRRFVVISEKLAGELFGGTAEAVGKQFLLDFQEVRVVGVVRNVSSIFQTAYADVWEPFTLIYEENMDPSTSTGGLIGFHYTVLHLSSDASPDEVRAEVNRRMEQLNKQGVYPSGSASVYAYGVHLLPRWKHPCGAGLWIVAGDSAGSARRRHIRTGPCPDAEPVGRDSHPQGVWGLQCRHHRTVVCREPVYHLDGRCTGLCVVVCVGSGRRYVVVRYWWCGTGRYRVG